MRSTSGIPAEKQRFLLELWIEPRMMTVRILRLRGRITRLRSHEPPSAAPVKTVASIKDIDSFIHESFKSSAGVSVRWEVEP